MSSTKIEIEMNGVTIEVMNIKNLNVKIDGTNITLSVVELEEKFVEELSSTDDVYIQKKKTHKKKLKTHVKEFTEADGIDYLVNVGT